MYQARHRFSFTSMALPGDTFAVISFTGHTALSTLFDYDITLASKQKDLDLTDILSNPATFTSSKCRAWGSTPSSRPAWFPSSGD